MGQNSKIEWCDATFNPWLGCTKVSPACDNCYAEAWAKRTGQAQLWAGAHRRTAAANWRQPLKWSREAERAGVRRRVFCASLADVFDNQVPDEWRADLWQLIFETPQLDWLLLTKRPQNIAKMLPTGFEDCALWPWPNVWLGTTAENQEELVRRRIHLLSVPAAVHFLSCEPLLHPVWLPTLDTYPYQVDWVIVGGESGPHARQMHPNWARSLRDQCAEMGIAFFCKQMTKKAPIPEDLMVRQFPALKPDA
jgi:protein gp37